jgi:hypothetical protein
MTNMNRTRSRRATAGTSPRPARRRHAENFSDAVVAAYIHEISDRHQAASPTPQQRARRPAYQAR